ncbi:MAG: hypothetical protein ABIK94_03290 [candidate division WOR-3 bacterium]
MKKIILSLLFVFSLFWATNFSFSPPKAKGKVGEIKTFQLEAQYQHIPCLVGIKTVEISYENLLPISTSEWESLSPGRFRKIITVKLKREGRGKIKVSHLCPIKESKGEVIIEIEKRTFEEAYREARNLLSDLFLGKDINLEYLKATLEELLANSPQVKDKETKDFLAKAKLILQNIERIFKTASEIISGD